MKRTVKGENDTSENSEDLEDDLNSSYSNNQKNQNNDIKHLIAITGLLGLLRVIRNQPDEVVQSATEELESTGSKAEELGEQLFPEIDRSQLNLVAKEGEQYLSDLQSITDTLTGLNSVEWPGYIENLAFKNHNNIVNSLGMFGGVESTKQGVISTYKEAMDNSLPFVGKVMIPWVTEDDDHVCDDCLDLADNGPYEPDNYPEPPHDGCRCWPGEPVIIYNTDMFSAMRTI